MNDGDALDTRDDSLALGRTDATCRVETGIRCDAPPEEVWRGILYYEQISERPPLLLRLLLPVPIRTVGDKSAVGDEAHCEYVGGYLRKRVTELEPSRLYRFSVIEQDLPLPSVHLHGGAYVIEGLSDGASELRLETRYTSGRRPRWLWKRVEAAVCHAFHRHILRAMVRAIEEAPRLPAAR